MKNKILAFIVSCILGSISTLLYWQFVGFQNMSLATLAIYILDIIGTTIISCMISHYLIMRSQLLNEFRWYRKMFKGAIWYHYKMTGQLPGCYGDFWSQKEFPPHRYYELIDVQVFGNGKTKN